MVMAPNPPSLSILSPIADFDLTAATAAAVSAAGGGPLIHVGTASGDLLLLSAAAPSPLALIRSVPITRRSIDSIIPLPVIDRILALSDGSLFLADPLLLHPPHHLTAISNVLAVTNWIPLPNSPNPVEIVPKLDTVKPRQRLLSKLRSNGASTRVPEVRSTDGTRTSCFIAAAIGKRLVVIELLDGGEVGRVREVAGVEGVKTIAWIGDSIVVGTLKEYTVVSLTTGKGTVIFSLPEGSGLPRVKGLWGSKEMLLLVDNVGVAVDVSGQPVGGSLVFGGVPESIAEMKGYVVTVRDGRLDVVRRKTGVCVQSLSVGKGVGGECIVAGDEQGIGEVLVVASPYKVICYQKVSAEEQIKDLLRKKNFKEAIILVEELEIEGEMTEEMASFVHAQVGFLLLFDLHFEDAVSHFLLSETMQPSEIFPFVMRDPNRWSHLVPRNRYWGLHPPPVPLEEVVDDGLMAIQRAVFLKKAGVDTAVDEDFLSNPPSRADLLESAIKNIIRYLSVSRSRDLIPSIKEGVDTLLMYLYRALNHVDDMEQLASSENHCAVEELETLLDDSGHLRTLAFLYASKGMCSKSLSIWRMLAKNYSTGLWKDPVTALECNSLGGTTYTLSSERAAAVEASKLLEVSSDQDMVLEHLGWIANIDPELAIIVLTSGKRDNQLSPEEVLAAVDPKKVEIHQRYLQWLIEDQHSEDTRFHTLYALYLAKSSLDTIDIGFSNETKNSKITNGADISDVTSTCLNEYSVRERLQLFLQDSDLYDPEDVLDVIEVSELWMEKAILYRKMGQESMVLEILALKLEDSEAAEQYCAEIGRSDAYMQLLDMYLDPQDGKEPMFNAAVRLLHNHGESLDPLQVLEKLSPEMPLQLASDTILRMLRARAHHRHQGQVVCNLSRAINLDKELARLEERSRHVQINDESICDSCHSRLGTKLFAMYPDNSVVCYKCYRRQGESTSPHGRDFKRVPIIKPGWLVTR